MLGLRAGASGRSPPAEDGSVRLPRTRCTSGSVLTHPYAVTVTMPSKCVRPAGRNVHRAAVVVLPVRVRADKRPDHIPMNAPLASNARTCTQYVVLRDRPVNCALVDVAFFTDALVIDADRDSRTW